MSFEKVKNILNRQYQDILWQDGTEYEVLEQQVLDLEQKMAGESRAIIKAETFRLLLEQGQIALTEHDIFQEKVNAVNIMHRQRNRWFLECRNEYFEESFIWSFHMKKCGTLMAQRDFGHVSSDTEALLCLGLSGLKARLQGDTEFARAGRTVLQALQDLCLRFAEALDGKNDENAACFRALAERSPQTLYEAMQLIIVYFYAHEYVGGTRVRTLGRLDRMLQPFYERDLQNGVLTREKAMELMKYFLFKFWTMDVCADMPFAIGGRTKGKDAVCEMSYIIVEAYDSLNIYSPKIHVFCSPTTPKAFVKRVMACVRDGHSSFVFIHDDVVEQGLIRCGIEPEDAANYIIIGCYEASAYGQELPCTATAFLSMPKLVEFALTDGRDHGTRQLVAKKNGRLETYEDFLNVLRTQMTWLLGKIMKNVNLIESHYPEVNPDPLLSVMLDPCVEKGVDVYSGGAKYNNCSVTMQSIGSFADMVYAVKKLVFEEKRVTLKELAEILKNDWEGHEDLRQAALALPKYGNNIDEVDAIAAEFGKLFADTVNNYPNSRGGVFKAGNHSIDHCFKNGKVTMATPDGRKAGEPLSKNLCAATGMDKKGITAMIHSAAKMDGTLYPNGSVLDIVLHPTAVQGEEGLDMMHALLMTFFKKGGFALHGNVFDAAMLRKAQEEPEKFANLQVRVCGWNAYFHTLTKAEQDAFIKQAEMAQG